MTLPTSGDGECGFLWLPATLTAWKVKGEDSGPFVRDQKGRVKRSLKKGQGSAAHSCTGLSHREEGQHMVELEQSRDTADLVSE